MTCENNMPTKWREWIRSEWPFTQRRSDQLQKFGTFVHWLRFKMKFDYDDIHAYVEKAIGRPLELGEFDDVMQEWNDDMLRRIS